MIRPTWFWSVLSEYWFVVLAVFVLILASLAVVTILSVKNGKSKTPFLMLWLTIAALSILLIIVAQMNANARFFSPKPFMRTLTWTGVASFLASAGVLTSVVVLGTHKAEKHPHNPELAKMRIEDLK